MLLPVVKQSESYDCGRAAVACVCRLFVSTLTPNSLHADPHNGTHPSEVATFLRMAGFEVLEGSMLLADLRHFTLTGRPVLVPVTFDGTGHWVVVESVLRGKVRFMCPVDGMCSEKSADFVQRWFDHDWKANPYDRWGVVAWK